MPVPYSEVTVSTPMMTAQTWAIIMPHVMKDPGDSSASSLASQLALPQQISVVRAAPSTTRANIVHHVDRTVHSLIHSARRVLPKPAGSTSPLCFVVTVLVVLIVIQP